MTEVYQLQNTAEHGRKQVSSSLNIHKTWPTYFGLMFGRQLYCCERRKLSGTRPLYLNKVCQHQFKTNYVLEKGFRVFQFWAAEASTRLDSQGTYVNINIQTKGFRNLQLEYHVFQV